MADMKLTYLSDHLAFISGDLFSQFFVSEIVAGKAHLPSVSTVSDSELQSSLQSITEIVRKYDLSSDSNLGEKKVEDIIKEVLAAIDFVAEKPKSGCDMVLFHIDDQKFASKWDGESEEGFRRCASILEAKKTKVSGGLDGRYQNETFSEQLVRYLDEKKVDWGILTNAITWRIYYLGHRDASRSYYEVNLLDVVSHQDLHAFRYFYMFFRSKAFRLVSGLHPLKEVWLQKAHYLAEVKENLQARFVESIEYLAQGIALNHQVTEEETEDLFVHCFRIAYRAIFLKILEDRRAFPLPANSYNTTYGIRSLDNFVESNREDLASLAKKSFSLYDLLLGAFEEFKSGRYGIRGDLFSDAKEATRVKKYRIPDFHMANALYCLFYLEKDGKERRVTFDCFSDRDLGTLYESLFRHSLKIGRNSVHMEFDAAKAKRFGSFYTEEYICDHMVERAFGEFGVNDLSADEILALKVCDPAMGSGHFLLAAVKYLAKRLSRTGYLPSSGTADKALEVDYMREVLQKCIRGIDINPMAVDLAKLSLWLNTSKKGTPFVDLGSQLRSGDALISDQQSSPSAIDLSKAGMTNIDLVVGNPPFIETKLLRDEEKSYLYKNYGSMFEKSNYYVCFFERSLKVILKEGGILCLVCPPDWLDYQRSYKPFKKFLCEKSVVLEICKLDDKAFPVPTNYYLIRNAALKGAYTVKRAELPDPGSKNQYVVIENEPLSAALNLEVRNEAPRLALGKSVKEISLADDFEICTGLSISDTKVNKSFNGRDRFLKKGIRDALNIRKSDVKSGFNYEYCASLASSADRMRSRELFDCEKVIVKRRPLTVLYDDYKAFCKSNCLVLKNKKGQNFSLKYVALMLNATPMKRVLQRSAEKAQVGKDLLAEVKIPYVDCDIDAFYDGIKDLPYEAQVAEIDEFFFGIKKPAIA